VKKQDFHKLVEQEFETIMNLTRSKGEEYSRSEDDQLANFKRNAKDLHLSAEQVWAVYFNKHVDSIKSYIQSYAKNHHTEPNLSEPIEGRISDAILYLLLFKAIIADRRKRVF
jgi:hypothetical protein